MGLFICMFSLCCAYLFSVSDTLSWWSRCFWHLTHQYSYNLQPNSTICLNISEQGKVIYLRLGRKTARLLWHKRHHLCPTAVWIGTRKKLPYFFSPRSLKGARCFGWELKERKPQRWTRSQTCEKHIRYELVNFYMTPMWVLWSKSVDQSNHSAKTFLKNTPTAAVK